MKKPLKEQLKRIGGEHLLNEVSTEKVDTKEIAKKFPKLAIGGLDLIKKIGFGMLFGGPSTMGADLIPESVLNDMAEDLGVKEKEQISLAGGGMANMDDIIKPIGV